MSKPPRLGRQIREYEVDSIIVPDTACIDKNVSAWTSVDVAILKLKPLPILRPTSLSFYDESTYDSITMENTYCAKLPQFRNLAQE